MIWFFIIHIFLIDSAELLVFSSISPFREVAFSRSLALALVLVASKGKGAARSCCRGRWGRPIPLRGKGLDWLPIFAKKRRRSFMFRKGHAQTLGHSVKRQVEWGTDQNQATILRRKSRSFQQPVAHGLIVVHSTCSYAHTFKCSFRPTVAIHKCPHWFVALSDNRLEFSHEFPLLIDQLRLKAFLEKRLHVLNAARGVELLQVYVLQLFFRFTGEAGVENQSCIFQGHVGLDLFLPNLQLILPFGETSDVISGVAPSRRRWRSSRTKSKTSLRTTSAIPTIIRRDGFDILRLRSWSMYVPKCCNQVLQVVVEVIEVHLLTPIIRGRTWGNIWMRRMIDTLSSSSSSSTRQRCIWVNQRIFGELLGFRLPFTTFIAPRTLRRSRRLKLLCSTIWRGMTEKVKRLNWMAWRLTRWTTRHVNPSALRNLRSDRLSSIIVFIWSTVYTSPAIVLPKECILITSHASPNRIAKNVSNIIISGTDWAQWFQKSWIRCIKQRRVTEADVGHSEPPNAPHKLRCQMTEPRAKVVNANAQVLCDQQRAILRGKTNVKMALDPWRCSDGEWTGWIKWRSNAKFTLTPFNTL